MNRMTQMAMVALGAMVIAISCGCSGPSQEGTLSQSSRLSETDTLQESIEMTMAEARRAIDEHGLTAVAMQRIQTALTRLGQVQGLKEQGNLRELHGGGAASAVLSSDGEDGLTLILARFRPGKVTPIHDHGTWAVAYVLEGQERYIQWKRLDVGGDPDHARIQVDYERVLNAGDAVYWLNPPLDIHSQEALGGVTWELLLFGRNPQHGTLQYFDLETGRVTRREAVAPSGAGGSQ